MSNAVRTPHACAAQSPHRVVGDFYDSLSWKMRAVGMENATDRVSLSGLFRQRAADHVRQL
jgi:hypothetical protein